MEYSKEQIKEFLKTNKSWIERALVVLHDRQTEDEQSSGETIEHNGRGFNGVDSRYLSYCAKWVKGKNPLNEKHMGKCGKMLPKYWKQIQELIKEKQ